MRLGKPKLLAILAILSSLALIFVFQSRGQAEDKEKGLIRKLAEVEDRIENLSARIAELATRQRTPQIWGVNKENDIFRWNGEDWTQVPGKLRQISVGPDGSVWGVNGIDEIFRWTGQSWQKIPGRLIHVDIGSSP